ncbi:Aldo/keto reductase [Cylindrobasidium torrendii FP15055 ss-10]|uniref:Aldo/keto reductase n=1 Tax=Cylindrobasidium torrendii FP15055 ss-10 TaxID=1314674 RepID=A0A0D7B9A7_9AGAR|nr:Aldo/keto reductase [Cylindrobasidium torrendii FP15055 ss-10]
MLDHIHTFKLNSGAQIPWLAWGNGTGDPTDSEVAIDMGRTALEKGIRHIDTAQKYENENETNVAIRQAHLKKQDLWVTSKFSGAGEGRVMKLHDVRDAVMGSLVRLGFTPDVYLIHNPYVVAREDLKGLWTLFETLQSEGVLKDIGVSNFRPQDFELILDGAKVKPAVHQVEYHPFLLAHLQPVLDICEKNGIVTEAYGPLGPLIRHESGSQLKPVLERIAKRITQDNPDLGVNIEASTILLLWTRAQGVVAVTTSGKAERIEELAKVSRLQDHLLKKEEIQEITDIGKKYHFRAYPEHMENEFPVPNLPDGR